MDAGEGLHLLDPRLDFGFASEGPGELLRHIFGREEVAHLRCLNT